MQWVDIVLYGAILTIIEASRQSIARAAAKHSFSSYADYFHQLKNKNQGSSETKKMEDEVHSSHDWAVRIEDVSRLFINTAGKPILDPVACHCVQEMILEHKGEKTFMLCTHLLNEAELLCDIISIMVRGNVYTVGTPQYLTQKFGTEYQIDIMLDDASEVSETKIDQFFNEKLPFAQLTIERPASRIYSVPATKIQLAELFLVLENGQRDNNGYKYFTCSTSSLEREFMEIVRISQQQQENKNNPSSNENEKQKENSFTNNKNKNTDEIHLDIKHKENESDNSVNNIP